MPTYRYACEDDHEFEIVQKITDDPLTICHLPTGQLDGTGNPYLCGKALRRLVPSGTSFVLKGVGWSSSGYSGKKPSGGGEKAT